MSGSSLFLRRFGIALAAAIFLIGGFGLSQTRAHAARAVATPLPTGEELLRRIRAKFRSHRPPPPYETYTMTRKENTELGYPDFAESYTYHIWMRSSDRAALGRKVYRGSYRGTLEFMRPSFNEPWDPGPPTADVFEPAPVHQHASPLDFVPTPEPNVPKEIATVRAVGELDYRVTASKIEGNLLHVSVVPRREPDRNRLREIYVDKNSLELQKLVATDKLFVPGFNPFPVIFTIYFGTVQGMPVVTDIHGDVDPSYVGDGEQVDYHYRDITFPASLPDWYFNNRQYAQHQAEAPI